MACDACLGAEVLLGRLGTPSSCSQKHRVSMVNITGILHGKKQEVVAIVDAAGLCQGSV